MDIGVQPNGRPWLLVEEGKLLDHVQAGDYIVMNVTNLIGPSPVLMMEVLRRDESRFYYQGMLKESSCSFAVAQLDFRIPSRDDVLKWQWQETVTWLQKSGFENLPDEHKAVLHHWKKEFE